MIEYIIRTNRIKHSYQIQKVAMKQKKKLRKAIKSVWKRAREKDVLLGSSWMVDLLSNFQSWAIFSENQT